MLFGGITLIAAGIIIPSLPPSAFEDGNLTEPNVNLSGIIPSFIGGAALAIGGVITAIGIISFIVAYGLLKGTGWAWTMTVVLSIISIVLNAISIATGNIGGIVSVIISAIILYYLYRPQVKEYFGKAARTDATPAA
jgi:multisubunit Na+/H+ antiporter MnhG subunit